METKKTFRSADSALKAARTAAARLRVENTALKARLIEHLDVIRRIALGRRGLLHTQEYARALDDAERIYAAMEKPCGL